MVMPQTTSNKHDSMIRINKRELKDQLDLSKEEFSYALKKQLKKKNQCFYKNKNEPRIQDKYAF